MGHLLKAMLFHSAWHLVKEGLTPFQAQTPVALPLELVDNMRSFSLLSFFLPGKDSPRRRVSVSEEASKIRVLGCVCSLVTLPFDCLLRITHFVRYNENSVLP
ncbi:Zinc finger BED domain-containing protein RICESLEEPER 3 [Fusarium oxysporum f. sp. albedinis]|nr:Zinc finger BED domain-containing protein RICESLEEPER 3 [Fusarium oxysporum f. sp. albedinis]